MRGALVVTTAPDTDMSARSSGKECARVIHLDRTDSDFLCVLSGVFRVSGYSEQRNEYVL